MSADELTCAWPNGHRAAVCLTFDVDADAELQERGLPLDERLTAVAERRFSVTRGLPRILDLLRECDVPATFYVPGWVVERYPREIAAILEAGHEVGHHGHLHLNPGEIEPEAQQAEIVNGLEALERVLGVRPAGYRAPAWQLTTVTLGLLLEHGFSYDSSSMGDDRPYLERSGDLEILELPVHWSLDDYVYFSFRSSQPGSMAAPDTLLATWRGELDSARRDGRCVTYTAHPEVIGRGYRAEALRAFLNESQAAGDVWFARHSDVASCVRPVSTPQ